MALTSKKILIARYEKEIRQQSPLASQLKIKRDELNFLKGRYTEANPLVREKLFEIQNLEKQIADGSEKEAELSEFTGSDLGNQLYLEILSLRGEIEQHEQSVRDLTALIATREAEVSELPQKQLVLQQLKSRRAYLLDALVILRSRMQEAEFFVNNAPGYLRIFQKPGPSDVAKSTQQTKTAILGLLGLVSGLLVSGAFSVIWELTNKGLRTPLQACAAAQTRWILRHYSGSKTEKSLLPDKKYRASLQQQSEQDLREFWLTQLMDSRGLPKVSTFIAIQALDEEAAFGKMSFGKPRARYATCAHRLCARRRSG